MKVPFNRLRQFEDHWGIEEYIDGIVEIVDGMFMKGGLFSAHDRDVPERKAAREVAFESALNEIKGRIEACLTQNELREAFKYVKRKKEFAASRYMELYALSSQLEEYQILVMQRCHQQMMCLGVVASVSTGLLEEKFERAY